MAARQPTDHKPTPPQEGSQETDAEVKALAEEVAAACQAEQDQHKKTDSESDLATELAAEQDRVKRLQAEMENLRNRTAREIAEQHRYAAMPVVRELLPVLDNIDRAIEAAEQADEPSGLLEGFKLVRQQLLDVLERHHCLPIESEGQPFDPQVHEAILQQASDEHPANHVLMETQVGYLLHDRVVRPSQVIVSTGPAEG